MVGGKTTAHAYLFIRLAEGLGISRDTLFATDYLPTTMIEKNELFLLQRSSTVEALCGGNLATESINPIHMGRTAEALEKHYGVPRAALEFYHVHMEVEDEHAARAVTILEKIAVTDEEQSRTSGAAARAHRSPPVRRRDAAGLRGRPRCESVTCKLAPSSHRSSRRSGPHRGT